jgi:hypothetical protein
MNVNYASGFQFATVIYSDTTTWAIILHKMK